MSSYYKYKSNIKSGDLLAWGTRKNATMGGIFSNIVRLFTMSEYSHVGIALVVNQDIIFVIEADIPRTKITPLQNTTPFYHIPANLEWKKEYTDFLLSRVGSPYPIWHAVRAYFGEPRKSKKKKNPGLSEGLICTELVDDFYTYVLGKDFTDKYTPSDVVEKAMDTFNSSIHIIRQ